MNAVARDMQKSKQDLGHTIRQMARCADCDQSQVSQWMNGHVIPNAANLTKLVAAGYVQEATRRSVLLGEDAA